jgi:NAD(P)H-hydrate repair Nnr-like enzyme with NAD(P)H-hydrate epimerase domain
MKPDAATALDKDLMENGYQLAQLMELAGLSVAEAGMRLSAMMIKLRML